MKTLHMNDYKDINDLISSTEANKSAYVDYLLEYVEGDYHCLDGSADNEIFAFSSFALKFKHIYALATLLKLQEATDTSQFSKAFSDEFQINIKQESEELENLLFYIRHSLPEDLLYNNCERFRSGNGVIQNKWNYPYDILGKQEKIIESLKHELSNIKDKYRGIINEQEIIIEELRHELSIVKDKHHVILCELQCKVEELKCELAKERSECEEYKHKFDRIKEQITKLAAVNPGLAIMLKFSTF